MGPLVVIISLFSIHWLGSCVWLDDTGTPCWFKVKDFLFMKLEYKSRGGNCMCDTGKMQ